MQTLPIERDRERLLVPDDGILCIHFAAGGREHSMWYLDADELGPSLSGFTAHLAVESFYSPAGFRRASVLRRAGDMLCDALFMDDSSAASADRTPSSAEITTSGRCRSSSGRSPSGTCRSRRSR